MTKASAPAAVEETEVEDAEFFAKPGEPLHGTQFQRIVTDDDFTRLGWELHMRMWSYYLQRQAESVDGTPLCHEGGLA